MTESAKRAFWVGGWVLTVGAHIGAVPPIDRRRMRSGYFLTRELVEAIQAQHILEYLDGGAPYEAKANLHMRMDGHILVIGSLLDTTSSEKDREAAKNSFTE